MALEDYVKFIPLTSSEEVARKINYRQGKQLESQLRCLEQEERHCTSILKKKVMGLNREMERLVANRENCLRYITVADDGSFCIELTRQKRLKERMNRKNEAINMPRVAPVISRHASTGALTSHTKFRQRLPSLPNIKDGTIITSSSFYRIATPPLSKPNHQVKSNKESSLSAPVCIKKENKENKETNNIFTMNTICQPPTVDNVKEKNSSHPVYDPKVCRNVAEDLGWIMNIRTAEDAFDLKPLTQVLETKGDVLPSIRDKGASFVDKRKSKNDQSLDKKMRETLSSPQQTNDCFRPYTTG